MHLKEKESANNESTDEKSSEKSEDEEEEESDDENSSENSDDENSDENENESESETEDDEDEDEEEDEEDKDEGENEHNNNKKNKKTEDKSCSGDDAEETVDEEEDEDEENSEEDDGDDDDEESTEEFSDEDDSEDESDSEEASEVSDDEHTFISLKVFVSPAKDLRGFCVPKHRALKRISKRLCRDYGAEPKLFYLDPEGDRLLIARTSDLEYASRMHDASAGGSGSAVTKLRLVAEFDGKINSDKFASRSESKSGEASRRSPKRHHHSDKLKGSPSSSTRHHKQKGIRFEADDDFPSETRIRAADRGALGEAVEHHEADAGRSHELSSTDEGEVLWQRGDVIGAGSFGQVFSGIDVSSGRMIAVKEVALGGGRKHKEQAFALQQEIRILSSLDHPNIIKYLGGIS